MASRKTPVSLEPAEGAGPAGELHAAWRLPSGQDLVSFALATGFAAQPLLEKENGDETAPVDSTRRGRSPKRIQDRPETPNGVRREG
jgi:hypothetical protein